MGREGDSLAAIGSPVVSVAPLAEPIAAVDSCADLPTFEEPDNRSIRLETLFAHFFII